MDNTNYLIPKITCIAGAAVDAFFGVAMLWPKLWGLVFGLADFNPGLRYQIDMGVGAALMFGWTILLLWTLQKPLERKEVFLFTAFPVLTGIGLAGATALVTGQTTLDSLMPVFLMKIVLFTLLVYSYLSLRRMVISSAHAQGISNAMVNA